MIKIEDLINEQTDMSQVSDGFHTFAELYESRTLLWIRLCLGNSSSAFWRHHLPGWPILGMKLSTGQISFHVEEKYLPLFSLYIDEGGPEWDGHTTVDVHSRLLEEIKRGCW